MNLRRINTLSLLLFLSALSLAAACKSPTKPEPDIAGQYSTNSGGDEQGGGAIYVLPDHRFVMVYFGGAAMGTWEIKDSTVLFKPQTKQSGFNVYARHNNKLGDSVRVFFDNFATAGGAAIGFDASSTNVKPVFNDDPNCVDFPSIGKFAAKPSKIVLAARPVDQGGSVVAGSDWHIFTCDNADHYNDFIAQYNPISSEEHSQDFAGQIKNGKLHFDQKTSARKPLPKAQEMKEIYKLLNTPLEPEYVFYNPYFKEAEPGVEQDTLNYRFDKQKDAYISFRNYVEGEENKSQKDGDYNGTNVIYKYRKLNSTNTTGQLKPDNKPIFTAKCKDQ